MTPCTMEWISTWLIASELNLLAHADVCSRASLQPEDDPNVAESARLDIQGGFGSYNVSLLTCMSLTVTVRTISYSSRI